MNEYGGEKRSILARMAKKTNILHFEVRVKNSEVSVEDGVAKCFLQGRNTIVIQFDHRDLGGLISKLRSMEILNTYNAIITAKSFELINNDVHIEIETNEDLNQHSKEVLIEVRLTYKLT